MNKERMCIVMEFCPFGNLSKLLYSEEKISPSFKKKCALDSAKGMAFLHQNGIIHRDFKPDNLLIVSKSEKSSVSVKITDFGARFALLFFL